MSSTSTSTGVSLQFQYQDPNGTLRNLPHPLQTYQIPFTRSFTAKGILAIVDVSAIIPDMYNDGGGIAFRDTDIMFNGKHTLRLSPQQTTTILTNPGTTANTNGVVCKFRRNTLLGTTGIPSNVFGWEHWIRWTSNNNFSSNAITSTSLYNRDGTNLWIGRIWFNLGVTPITINVLNNSGTYTQVGTYNMADGGTYQPENGLFDRAGQWSYIKLVIDMYNKVYKNLQFNELFIDLTNTATLSNNTLYSTADTGTRVMHFSVEYAQQNSLTTERFINIAQPVATFE